MSLSETSGATTLRRGMTLIEVVTSMAVMTVLVAGLASALVIAGHALPGHQSAAAAARQGGAVANRIAADLSTVTVMQQWTSTSVTAKISDRNGDEQAETIQYTWSGDPTHRLTRCFNGSCVSDFLEDVQELTFGYTTRAATLTGSPTPSESAETILVQYADEQNTSQFQVGLTTWVGQYFKPYLPNNTVSWRVTRVSLILKHSGLIDGAGKVQLRLPTGSLLPSAQVVEQVSFYESQLSSGSRWEEFAFSNVNNLSPSQGLCLVVSGDLALGTCQIRYKSGGVSMSNSHMVQALTGGLLWSVVNGSSLVFVVHGTITTNSGAPEVQEVLLVTGVDISLRCGDNSDALVRTAVPLVNEPEVLAP